MTPITPRRAAPLVLLSSFLVAAPAAAQTAPRAAPSPAATQHGAGYLEQRATDGARVVFDDDLAVGAAFDPLANIVKAPPRAGRMQLIRPRTDFVQELVKTVENL